MPAIGYLNGEFLPLEEVKVSVEDRGFQFGDGVYEVIRVYDGRPFKLQEHLTRLAQSAEAIQLSLPFSSSEWEAAIFQGLRLCEFDHCKVYLQVTRGVAPREHQFPANVTPTILMTFRELRAIDQSVRDAGVSAITLPDLRWGLCYIKSLNLLPNVLAKQQAVQAGAFEAILVRNEMVTEGTASNVMMVSNGMIATPALTHHLLAGVTRQVILDMAQAAGIVVEERSISGDEMKQADEIFLAGTTIEVLAVVNLDGRTIGDGRPGPITKSLAARFRRLIGGQT